MNSLIIGAGEIGNSLRKVIGGEIIGSHYDRAQFDIIHICFPYSEEFESEVKRYQELHKPKYTVIHSTVPVGTCRKLGAIHHPVIGMHPNLAKSFLIFTQLLSGKKASEVTDYFRRKGLRIYLLDNQETTELGKFSQTTFYALMIEYIKTLKKECDNKGLSFTEVYTLFSKIYNEGYEKLGYPEYKMPLLTPIMTKQGGHCTLPNLEFWDNDFTALIKKLNNDGIDKNSIEYKTNNIE